MDTKEIMKAVAELHAERDRIDQTILALEQLALGTPRGPGRPRKYPNSLSIDPKITKRSQRVKKATES